MLKSESYTHHGRNVKRIRELLGYKQEYLAIKMDITQQSVSEIEQREYVNKKTLVKIANVLKIPVEVIENLSDKRMLEYTNEFMDNIVNRKRKVSEGRIIKFLREYLNISVDKFASDLGISVKEVSELEQKEVVADSILEKIANTLKVPVKAIKNMTEEAIHNYINTFNEAVTNQNGFYNFNCTFNPIDKIVELYKEKEDLHKEKQNVYERMLKEKNELIEKLLNK